MRQSKSRGHDLWKENQDPHYSLPHTDRQLSIHGESDL